MVPYREWALITLKKTVNSSNQDIIRNRVRESADIKRCLWCVDEHSNKEFCSESCMVLFRNKQRRRAEEERIALRKKGRC